MVSLYALVVTVVGKLYDCLEKSKVVSELLLTRCLRLVTPIYSNAGKLMDSLFILNIGLYQIQGDSLRLNMSFAFQQAVRVLFIVLNLEQLSVLTDLSLKVIC